MAATSGNKAGVKAKLYRNTGTYGTPTWTELTFVRDVNIGQPWDFSEASIRATRVKLYAPSQKDFAPTVTVKCDNADPGYIALCAVDVTAGVIDTLVLDGALTDEGARGVRAHFHYSDTGQDQSVGVGAMYKTFEMKPGFSSEGWPMGVVVGASSALTMTAPG